MDYCYRCTIEQKIEYCCRSHPETGETLMLETDSGVFNACPNLDFNGDCSIYLTRPGACREYECPNINEIDLFDRMMQDL